MTSCLVMLASCLGSTRVLCACFFLLLPHMTPRFALSSKPAWSQVVLVDTFRDAPDYFWGVLQCFKKKAQLPPTVSAEPVGPDPIQVIDIQIPGSGAPGRQYRGSRPFWGSTATRGAPTPEHFILFSSSFSSTISIHNRTQTRRSVPAALRLLSIRARGTRRSSASRVTDAHGGAAGAATRTHQA